MNDSFYCHFESVLLIPGKFNVFPISVRPSQSMDGYRIPRWNLSWRLYETLQHLLLNKLLILLLFPLFSFNNGASFITINAVKDDTYK